MQPKRTLKNSNEMENLNFSDGQVMPEKLEGYKVALFKREEVVDKKIIGGKMLQWSDSKEITFVQNAPRGARSVEIGRTAHARIVRLTNGAYSVRTRFNAEERSIGYQLIAELREINKMAQTDLLTQKKKAIEEKKGGEK